MKKNKIQNLKGSFVLFFLSVFFLIVPIHNVFALTLTPIRLEISGDPGQTITKEITLINEKKTAETFYTSFENFTSEGETGNPSWTVPVDDLGTWMKSVDSVTLPAGGQKNVSFTITIPKNAEPGGHFAGIFWGTTPKVQSGGQVSIGAKTGVLVLLSVSGQVNDKGGVLEFATKNNQTFYTALPVDFYYRFQNNGNDRIKPLGDVVINNIFGINSTKIPGNPVGGNILPHSVRRMETSWIKTDSSGLNNIESTRSFFEQIKYEWNNFAFGYYTANLNLKYGVSGQTATSIFTFWVVPWQLLIVSIILLILAYLIIHGGLHSYNKWVIGRAEKMFEEREAQMHHIKKNTILHKVVGPRIKKK